jgi:pimeloyl-ACP methyl ester carboxylesterase
MRSLVLLIALAVLAGCGNSFAPAASSVDSPLQPQGATTGPLISGTVSWVDGTFVWTDYAYDDRATTPDAKYPQVLSMESLADMGGASVYPSVETANAADLIQLQLRFDGEALRIRAVLETLEDPALPLLGVGLDLDGDPQTGAPNLPGAGWNVQGTPLGLERLVVAMQGSARVMRWENGSWLDAEGAAPILDPAHNTIEVLVPAAELGATGASWRIVGVLGLNDAELSWLTPTGRIFDLAFVHDPTLASWQSGTQASVLSGQEDAAQAIATIDLQDFQQRRTSLAQPVAGSKQTYLYHSKLQLGEGIRASDRKYAGPYQPYAAWFPENLAANPPLIVLMHGALQNHLSGQYGTPEDDFAPDAVVVTPLGRSEAFGWYAGASEQDVLDVIADAQQRFGTDPDRIVLSGYSLGGVGTFALAQLYPDRWAGAIDIVGAPDLGLVEITEIALPQPYTLENLRNLPFRMGHSRADELEIIVGAIQPDLAALQLELLGYDYRYWQFYLRDHLNFPVEVLQCEYEAAIARGRVIDPARVVFSQEPALRWDEPDTGLLLRHDSAYWMSDMVVRGASFEPGDKGTVDITSLARPDRTPLIESRNGAGENITAPGDVCGDNPDIQTNDIWSVLGQAWTAFEDAPLSNGMIVNLTSVESVTLDVARMGLDVDEAIAIESSSDGAATLRLACPGGATFEVPIPAGASTQSVPASACSSAGRRK